MGLVPECDECGKRYEGGMKGSPFKTNVSRGKRLDPRDYSIEISVRPSFLCNKCLKSIIIEVMKNK